MISGDMAGTKVQHWELIQNQFQRKTLIMPCKYVPDIVFSVSISK
jgi:hypothetical protein